MGENSSRDRRTKLEREALVAVIRAAGVIERRAAELFKTWGLSLAQYNVLRILRGAGSEGATCGQVSERMMRHDPDVTRLLDRLEARQLISRTRDELDRRVVRSRITKTGLELLAELDGPVDELDRREVGHMSDKALASLRDLLGQVERSR